MKFFFVLALVVTSLIAFGQNKFPLNRKGSNDSIINGYESHRITDTVLNNEKTAVAVAEAILFNIYGKQQIESEKPYNVRLINGCWHINGSLPPAYVKDGVRHMSLGGVFSIVLNAADGKTVVFGHGK